MKFCRSVVDRRPIVLSLFLQFLVLLILAPGCNRAGAPPSDGRLAIENIAKWRQLFCADHAGKPPENEEALLQFVEKKLGERGETIDRSTFLVSPRDGQKYIIRYGKDSAKLKETDVTVAEKEGYGGKVLVAIESSRSREVDAADVPKLMDAKP